MDYVLTFSEGTWGSAGTSTMLSCVYDRAPPPRQHTALVSRETQGHTTLHSLPAQLADVNEAFTLPLPQGASVWTQLRNALNTMSQV